jgi:hypothetical protein
MIAVMFWLRRALLAIACLAIAALCMTLVGWLVPQVLGPPTNAVVAVVLGGLIYGDILRRERGRDGRSSGEIPQGR